jgi:Glyoxalase-like domain
MAWAMLPALMNLKRMSASGGVDLRTRDLTAEVRRVTDLGAATLTDVRSARTAGHGTSWHILAEPDGNEFGCYGPRRLPDGAITRPDHTAASPEPNEPKPTAPRWRLIAD